jgi:hypothetical protein
MNDPDANATSGSRARSGPSAGPPAGSPAGSEAGSHGDPPAGIDGGWDAAHPTLGFNDVVHQRARLGILSVLAEADRADFGYLKTLLRLTDGNLGRHLEVLADHGMITLVKGYEDRRPRTWATITPPGRKALQAELTHMRALLHHLEPPG